MFRWIKKRNWENTIYFIAEIIVVDQMRRAEKEGIDFAGFLGLDFSLLSVAFQIIVILIIARNWDWFGKKLNQFRKLIKWETIDEKFEREQQEQQNKWDEERRKRQEARTNRESLINKLIKNADVIWRLLNRDKQINPPYSELHEKCELITKTSFTKLKKYNFNLPDVLTVPIIGTDGPPLLSPENERFYENWREFCLYIVPFIEGEEEDRVQNIWYEKFDKS